MILHYQTTKPLLVSMAIAYLKLFWSRKQARTEPQFVQQRTEQDLNKQNLYQKQNTLKSTNNASKFKRTSRKSILEPERNSNNLTNEHSFLLLEM